MGIVLILLILAYNTYGRFVEKKLKIDKEAKTPAHTHYDGVDYVPAKAPVLLGHHFASIAGAAPIVGPIIAATFGWVPAILWILAGGIFFGAVHDFTSLIASVRHEGRSIGEVIEKYIGLNGKRLFTLFSFATLILVIGVFTDIVAKTFVSIPAVGLSSGLFILLAILFGISIYRLKMPLGPMSLAGVLLLFGAVWLGVSFGDGFGEFVSGIAQSIFSGLENPVYIFWVIAILVYIFCAAITPVWILLQPRDYLNSYLLYAMLGGGVIGLLFTGGKIQLQAYTGFVDDKLGYMFPILFVTIACGAISGFHSLVSSGTTSKQLDKESDARIVGYGGMLIEVLLASLALSTVAILIKSDYSSTLSAHGPVYLFAHGLGSFMSTLGIPSAAAITFTSLAVSAFALTSLDTSTRIARFMFQEFFSKQGRSTNILFANRKMGTAVAVILGGLLTLSGQFSQIWPIFGSANQLLAALALLTVSVWLYTQGKKIWFTVIPMIFMFTVTSSALVILIQKNLGQGNLILTLLGGILLILSLVLLSQGILTYKNLSNQSKIQANKVGS
jgi:carbon starvation protein